MLIPIKSLPLIESLGWNNPRALAALEAMIRREGEKFFWEFITEKQAAKQAWEELQNECSELRNTWAPILRSFARKARENKPLPKLASLSPLDKAKFDLFTKLIAKSAREQMTQCSFSICHSSLIGLLAMEHLWGPPTDSAIRLLSSERGEWSREIYRHEDGGKNYSCEHFQPWWYCYHFWEITPVEQLPVSRIEDLGISRHMFARNYWVITVGEQYEKLAGGAEYSLWHWDGTESVLIKNCVGIETY